MTEKQVIDRLNAFKKVLIDMKTERDSLRKEVSELRAAGASDSVISAIEDIEAIINDSERSTDSSQ